MDNCDIISPSVVGRPIHDILRYDSTASQKGGSVISMFKDLAVPAGLLYLQQTTTSNYDEEKSNEPISQSLYDKLFELAEAKPKAKRRNHKQTKRKKKAGRKKTRKYY